MGLLDAVTVSLEIAEGSLAESRSSSRKNRRKRIVLIGERSAFGNRPSRSLRSHLFAMCVCDMLSGCSSVGSTAAYSIFLIFFFSHAGQFPLFISTALAPARLGALQALSGSFSPLRSQVDAMPASPALLTAA